MKYAAFSALVASTNGAIFAPCTDTWVGATSCDEGEQCFDWQASDMKSSNGLKCGDPTNCKKGFKYTDTAGGGAEQEYFGACDGLSLFACTVGGSECDSVGGFKCADWTQADGTTQLGCAHDPSECGKPSVGTKYDVACKGLAGEACTSNTDCDAKVNMCTTEFNNQTYTFTDKTNVCMGMGMCGMKKDSTGKDNTTIYLCYNAPGTPCNSTMTCEKPNGDEKDVSCGYLAPGDMMHNLSTGMCVDATYCNDAAKSMNGTNVTYFGADAKLWCGSARTALAMGAAVVSAYLAM